MAVRTPTREKWWKKKVSGLFGFSFFSFFPFFFSNSFKARKRRMRARLLTARFSLKMEEPDSRSSASRDRGRRGLHDAPRPRRRDAAIGESERERKGGKIRQLNCGAIKVELDEQNEAQRQRRLTLSLTLFLSSKTRPLFPQKNKTKTNKHSDPRAPPGEGRRLRGGLLHLAPRRRLRGPLCREPLGRAREGRPGDLCGGAAAARCPLGGQAEREGEEGRSDRRTGRTQEEGDADRASVSPAGEPLATRRGARRREQRARRSNRSGGQSTTATKTASPQPTPPRPGPAPGPPRRRDERPALGRGDPRARTP